MFDASLRPRLDPPLNWIGHYLCRANISPNQITGLGLLIGLGAIPAIYTQSYIVALILILINRILDGLDGTLARLKGNSAFGGYFDSIADFLFYGSVPFAFSLANPGENSLAASLILFSFLGTGASFLAFAILAERFKIENKKQPSKAFYYLGGLTEGTETILYFCAICLFPSYFSEISYVFAGMCWLTISTRIYEGYRHFSDIPAPDLPQND